MKRTKIMCAGVLALALALGLPGGALLAAEKDGEGAVTSAAQEQNPAEQIYEGIQEAVQNVDTDSLKAQIREALAVMDERGISPAAIAWDVFGIDSGKNPADSIGGELVSGAQNVIEETSQNFVQDLFDSIVAGLGDITASLVELIKEKVIASL